MVYIPRRIWKSNFVQLWKDAKSGRQVESGRAYWHLAYVDVFPTATQQQLRRDRVDKNSKDNELMIKRKITNQNYNQLVTRGKGNSDTKAHQHGKAGSITVSWNNGSGAGSVVVAQRATTSVFVQRLTCHWSGNRQKHRMTTQS